MPALVDDTAADVTLTVYYYPTVITVNPQVPAGSDPTEVVPQKPGAPVDPDNDQSPKYPAGLDTNDLNRTATETIRYVNATGQTVAPNKVQSVDFTRTADVDLSTGIVTYGEWTPASGNGNFAAVTSPTVPGLTPDRTTVDAMTDEGPFPVSLVVTYYPTDQEVTVDNPKTPSDLLNPSNPDSPHYPSGLTDSDLEKVATRTVHFVDGAGRTVAPDVVETISYQRTATVDFSQPDNPQVAYGAWVAVGYNGFDAVQVPSVAGMTPDRTLVPALTFTGAAANTTVIVVYHAAASRLPETGGTTSTPHRLPSTGGAVTTSNHRPSTGVATAPHRLPSTGGSTTAHSYVHVRHATTTTRDTTPIGSTTPVGDGNTATAGHKLPGTGRTLPQTSDEHESTMASLGLTILGMLLGLVGYKKRRDDE
ncbi:adhesion exoprotein [Lacticaseibacillus thailandensis DSM 22698 = JCM 13996]|uniref:Adhesion exoprotein n=1 Tax=Lacticaseibacillus thailandensis DSM 22698 = JCM 13996 TaxID=1423810 RepID=A0A0R2C6L3_9LACO|nr:adhesion exoprotein [Lacticaseibacillus thailandensis DSM 22698 = JCM 13996]